MPEKKTDMVRRLVSDGDYKKALGIVKGFRLGITREESAKMTRAYECMVRPGFYGQIVNNPSDAINEGIRILTSLYGSSKKNKGEDIGDEW
ncbi:MAG: hypothetical protein LBL73_05365 [Synergistaceae bacterium]|nr:hypothetical protein [Synergistaceae bacterium]